MSLLQDASLNKRIAEPLAEPPLISVQFLQKQSQGRSYELGDLRYQIGAIVLLAADRLRRGHDRQQGTIINPEPILKLLQATFFQAVVNLTFLLDQFGRKIGKDKLALVFGQRCRKSRRMM